MGQSTTNKVVRLGVKSPRAQRRFRFRYLVVAAFVCWGGYVFFGVQQPLLSAQWKEQHHLSMQLQAASVAVVTLHQEIANLHTNKYIASLAEQKYHLIAHGEILFTSASPPSTP